MIEITLEDVGLEVRTLFDELRIAFNTYILSLDANSQVHGTYTIKELNNEKDAILNKVKELLISVEKTKDPVRAGWRASFQAGQFVDPPFCLMYRDG